MKLPRRNFLHLAAGAVALPAFSPLARAQAYPTRPMRIVVGFPAGGGTDIVARIIGQWLSERLGQPVIVENRPGAGANIATEAVVRAPPDGYTLLMAGSPNAINATLYGKLNFIRDIAPVAGLIRYPNVMVVHPSLPVKTVAEFIAYANGHPGKVNMASGGIGTGTHLLGELFKIMTGVNMVHVPYRGVAPALTDLLGGQVQVMFATTTGSVDYIRAGNLRALAVTTTRRWEAFTRGSDGRRFRAWLRSYSMVRTRRTQANARRNHRQAQQGDQRWPRRSQYRGAACQPRRHRARALARRLW
jgi:tripartite-type tricarboxylate transporter receptor subunit TctC